jgi:large subunit ribosomal protein L21
MSKLEGAKFMYAIIKSGGKQYRVEKGAVIDVELLGINPGAHVEFEEVLFFYDGTTTLVGEPFLANFVVRGEVLGEVAGPKIDTIKYKPSRNQYRRFGHRQHYSSVQIEFIGRCN